MRAIEFLHAPWRRPRALPLADSSMERSFKPLPAKIRGRNDQLPGAARFGENAGGAVQRRGFWHDSDMSFSPRENRGEARFPGLRRLARLTCARAFPRIAVKAKTESGWPFSRQPQGSRRAPPREERGAKISLRLGRHETASTIHQRRQRRKRGTAGLKRFRPVAEPPAVPGSHPDRAREDRAKMPAAG